MEKITEHEKTGILIVIGMLGTVFKGLVLEVEELEIRGRVKIFQTTASWHRLEY